MAEAKVFQCEPLGHGDGRGVLLDTPHPEKRTGKKCCTCTAPKPDVCLTAVGTTKAMCELICLTSVAEGRK